MILSMLNNSLRYSHELLSDIIEIGDQVVDATMGNGNDTLFLAEKVGTSGHVYAFDVQEQALINTTEKLKKHDCDKQVTLFLKGHETINDVLMVDQTIKAAVFNLGYLPKSDKQITTQKRTTIIALKALMDHLVEKGRIILVIYDGHEEGKAEKEEVISFVTTLPQENFSVLNYQFINQKNDPPSLICIEKKKARKF